MLGRDLLGMPACPIFQRIPEGVPELRWPGIENFSVFSDGEAAHRFVLLGKATKALVGLAVWSD